jgi:hypothetical protein
MNTNVKSAAWNMKNSFLSIPKNCPPALSATAPGLKRKCLFSAAQVRRRAVHPDFRERNERCAGRRYTITTRNGKIKRNTFL